MGYAKLPDGTILLSERVNDSMRCEIHIDGSDGKEIVFGQIPLGKRS
jgi:type 1 fimbria pilin